MLNNMERRSTFVEFINRDDYSKCSSKLRGIARIVTSGSVFPSNGGENFLSNLTGINIGMPSLVIFYHLYGSTTV